jgi:hypothetical protein
MFLILCGSFGGEHRDGRKNKFSLNIGPHLCKSAFTVNSALIFVRAQILHLILMNKTGSMEAGGDQIVEHFVDDILIFCLPRILE